jgi:hypothetical protein
MFLVPLLVLKPVDPHGDWDHLRLVIQQPDEVLALEIVKRSKPEYPLERQFAGMKVNGLHGAGLRLLNQLLESIRHEFHQHRVGQQVNLGSALRGRPTDEAVARSQVPGNRSDRRRSELSLEVRRRRFPPPSAAKIEHRRRVADNGW